MNTNKKSLLIIDSPFMLYVYSLMRFTDIVDILIPIGENYSNQEFEKLLRHVIPDNKVRNITFINESFNWNSIRNSSTIKSVRLALETHGITKKKINSYNDVYLNSYGSAIAFYFSTIRPYVAIQHSTIDINRHFPIQYFFETVKLFIRTKKIRHKYLHYCIANNLKSVPKKFSYYDPFKCCFNDEFHQSLDLDMICSEKDQSIGILLWTNHYSYDDPFNVNFINLNINIFDIAYKDYGKKLDLLIIKLHHRIPRPNEIQLDKIKSSFEKFGLKSILFDEIFDYEQPSRIYPIEMFIDIFNPSFVVGACTSAIWNSSSKLGCKAYSAFEYENLSIGRLRMVIDGLKSISKKLKYTPNDLTVKLYESNK